MNENAEIVKIPLALILVDSSWNARLKGWDQDEEFKTLRELIRADGFIRNPIDVRPATEAENRKGGFKYFLVSGFRRTAAAKELGHSLIPAIVNGGSDIECRLRNISENTSHATIVPSDIVWGFKQNLRELVLRKQDDIAQQTGLTQPMVSKYLSLARALQPKVLDAWRTSSSYVSVETMLKVVQKSDQWSEFKKLQSVGRGGRGNSQGGRPTLAQKARLNVLRAAEVVKILQERGFLSIVGNITVSDVIALLGIVSDTVDVGELRQLFISALEGGDDGSEEM